MIKMERIFFLSLLVAVGIVFIDCAAETTTTPVQKSDAITSIVDIQPEAPLVVKYGKAAPQWFRNLRVYNLYRSQYAEWIDKNNIRFDLLTHVPISEKLLKKYHGMGTKVMPYVNFMEKRKLEEKHPEWILINKEGKRQRSDWAVSHNIPGLFFTCMNSQAYHDFALSEVRRIMDMGYDGVFVDNVIWVEPCYGDGVAGHKHTWKDKTNTQCFYELVEKIYKVVKSYGDDKAVMINSANDEQLWQFCDSQMDEKIMFGGDTTERWIRWNRAMIRYWQHLGVAVKHGKVPVTLDRFDVTTNTKKMLNGAFMTYSATMLYDTLWTDSMSMLRDHFLHKAAKILYTLDLGKPLTEPIEYDSIFYRKFENGIVVINADEWHQRTIGINVNIDGEYDDLRASAMNSPDNVITTKDKKLIVTLDSGTAGIYLLKKK
jgi:hypothetical protein